MATFLVILGFIVSAFCYWAEYHNFTQWVDHWVGMVLSHAVIVACGVWVINIFR